MQIKDRTFCQIAVAIHPEAPWPTLFALTGSGEVYRYSFSQDYWEKLKEKRIETE